MFGFVAAGFRGCMDMGMGMGHLMTDGVILFQ